MDEVLLIEYGNISFPNESEYFVEVDTIHHKRLEDGTLKQIGHYAKYYLTPFELDDAIAALAENRYPPMRKVQPRDNLYHIVDVMRQLLSMENISRCKTAEEALKTAKQNKGDAYRTHLFNRLKFSRSAALFEFMECPIGYIHIGANTRALVDRLQHMDATSDTIADGPDSGPLERFFRTILRMRSTGHIDDSVYRTLQGYLDVALKEI